MRGLPVPQGVHGLGRKPGAAVADGHLSWCEKVHALWSISFLILHRRSWPAAKVIHVTTSSLWITLTLLRLVVLKQVELVTCVCKITWVSACLASLGKSSLSNTVNCRKKMDKKKKRDFFLSPCVHCQKSCTVFIRTTCKNVSGAIFKITCAFFFKKKISLKDAFWLPKMLCGGFFFLLGNHVSSFFLKSAWNIHQKNICICHEDFHGPVEKIHRISREI